MPKLRPGMFAPKVALIDRTDLSPEEKQRRLALVARLAIGRERANANGPHKRNPAAKAAVRSDGSLNNPRYEQFAQMVAAGTHYCDAYVAVGYPGNRRRAWMVKSLPHVKARIEGLIAGAAEAQRAAIQFAIEETGINKARVLRELGKIGFANIDDYTRLEGKVRVVDLRNTTRDQLAAIVEIADSGKGVVKIRLADKRLALVDIGHELGMFVSRGELTGKDGGPIEVKQVEERLARVRGILDTAFADEEPRPLPN